MNKGHEISIMGGGMSSGSNMMDQLKNNLMTMLMFKNMNNSGTSSSGSQDMFYIVYVFIITQLVDLFIKYLPVIIRHTQTHYFGKKAQTAKDITDPEHTVKTKSASIVIHIGVTDHENIFGQALLDHITNNPNTKHIKYFKQNFILNETDVISIDDEIFVIMTENETTQTTSDQTQLTSGQQQPSAIVVQKIEVFSFTKTTKSLRDFLMKLRHNFAIKTQNKLGDKRFYFNVLAIAAPREPGTKQGSTISDFSKLPPYFVFMMKEFQTNRKFSNLFGDEIDAIKQRVQFFIKNRKWYDEKGIPYTLGLLLSGAPGTGKTSCIKCLSNETNRHIVNINLNGDITKTQLENLFFNEILVITNPLTRQNEKYNIPLDQRIYVLEDIDCQGDVVQERTSTSQIQMSPEPEPMNYKQGGGEMFLHTNVPYVKDIEQLSSDKMDMSFLLNLLDGVLETPGRILIMTSNYPDTLDRALIRPGRIDIISKFKNCTNQTIVKMMDFFYNNTLTDAQKDIINKFDAEQITPAEMSKIMFENFKQPDATIRHLQQLFSNKK